MAVPENPSIGGSAAGEEPLEYRSSDEAWYDVDFSLDGDRLTIKYRSLSSTFDEVYEPGKFESADDVNAFRHRFRPSSLQAQDTDCRRIVLGMKVCGACCFDDGDLHYYDAFVQGVDHKEHSFENGEEQCSYSFTLKWQNGPKVGMIMTTGIGSVCFLQDGPLDRILVDFIRMSRKAVMNSSRQSRVVSTPISQTPDKEPSKRMRQEALSRQQITSEQLKDHGTYLDTRAAGVASNVQGRCHYMVAIENMEKDLSASTVLEFIHKETTISPEAHIFPSLKTDLFTRGILKVHSERDFRVLLEFLENPHHIVVSSHKRNIGMTREEIVNSKLLTLEQKNTH
uniref:SAWADEE domain-containing protein n=1 Tax=Kalanchoe fedtschenkoi TaxID=63787 RepID=A0A7N0TEI9_KALFE